MRKVLASKKPSADVSRVAQRASPPHSDPSMPQKQPTGEYPVPSVNGQGDKTPPVPPLSDEDLEDYLEFKRFRKAATGNATVALKGRQSRRSA
jgi:hypothetical protein